MKCFIIFLCYRHFRLSHDHAGFRQRGFSIIICCLVRHNLIGIAEVRNFIKNLSVERGKTILISSHILSEISLLADDIGIIDHGVLLEESSMEELEKKNRKYIQLQVSDIPKASLILERQFHVTDYAVQDEHNLRLYDTALDMAAINKALVVQDVAVISSQICNDTLEDYFKQITGGEGIA